MHCARLIAPSSPLWCSSQIFVIESFRNRPVDLIPTPHPGCCRLLRDSSLSDTMGPQSALSIFPPPKPSSGDPIMEIISAADEAYQSAHKRLDRAAFLTSCCIQPPAHKPRFQMKRKAGHTGRRNAAVRCRRGGESSCESAPSGEKKIRAGTSPNKSQRTGVSMSESFIGGLFADVTGSASSSSNTVSSSATAEEHYVTDDSCPGTPIPLPKRARLGFAARSKSYRSFAGHSNVGSSTDSTSTTDKVQTMNAGVVCSPFVVSHTPTRSHSRFAAATSDGPSVNIVNLLKTADALASDTVFPHLPTAVSDSFARNSSADLTQATAQLADPETFAASASSGSADGNETEYGWFLQLDDADMEVACDRKATESTSGECGLAFEAPKAARTVLNAEVEWAKAADTVDDVLGDFF